MRAQINTGCGIEKKTIVDRYKRAKENLMREFDKSTFEKGFKVRNTENGIY